MEVCGAHFGGYDGSVPRYGLKLGVKGEAMKCVCVQISQFAADVAARGILCSD